MQKTEHMNRLPLVSVITPSYNNADCIEAAIQSVLGQSYTNWEMLIVDDCSTDGSMSIAQRYAQSDKRIKALHNSQNLGAAQSRNRAIDAASGDYIAFLDSDDIWLPQKLEKQIELMQKNHLLLSYTSYYTMDSSGKRIGIFSVPEQIDYFDMLKTSTIGTLTTVYDAKALGKIYFREIGHEDYVWKLNILKRINFAGGLIEPLAQYRLSDNSLSNNKFKTALWQWHIYREVERLPLHRSLYYFVHYVYHGLTKYKKG